MKGYAVKNVFAALADTESKTSFSSLSPSLTELKPEQMITILQRLFGDSTRIIDPDLSLQASRFATGSAQAMGLLQYLQALQPLTPFKKPVVMLVAQPQIEQKSQTTISSSGSNQGAQVTVQAWRSIVIVPQNYRPFEGKLVGNDLNPCCSQPSSAPNPNGFD